MTQRLTRRQFGAVAGSLIAAVPTGRRSQTSQRSTEVAQQPDAHDVGERLRCGRPYFPMLLGNGEEHVLIGYAGAMGACAGHEHWSYDGVATGWFRPDTRHRPARGVLNLLQASYILRRGIHADGIDTADQTFDARTGILVTRCRFANAHVRVETLLTSDHLLVHRFAVSPGAADMALQFFVRTAFPRGPLSVAVGSENVPVPASLRDRLLPFYVVGPDWPKTTGWLLCDQPRASRVTCYNRQAGIEVPLTEPTEFTFVVFCAGPDERLEPSEAVERARRFEYAAVRQRHVESWQRFDSRSTVRLSHAAVEDIYRTSLYVVRAHQHPQMGGITVGAYPGMWSNGINSYDVSYGLMALLGANRLREAEQVVRFWQRILPKLRRRAAEAGLPGAACPAPMSPWGDSPPRTREQILEERHFITANIPLHVWRLYEYTGRLRVLRDYWECLAEPVEFLLGACVTEFADHAEIIRSSGPDGKERVDGRVVYRPNPIRTLLATVEAVRAIRRAADLLGKKRDPRWDRLLPKLERGIEANRFDGVVRASRSPDAPPRADAAYVGLFNCRTDARTLDAELRFYRGPDGFFRWPDHGYRAIPWSHLNVSAAFSRLGRPGAAEHVDLAARFTTTLHAFPEAVRPDGVFSKTWYPTVHGAFVHAVNLLLLRRRADRIELFAGLPPEWGDAEFHSLRVPFGLVVSAQRRGGRVTAELLNDSEQRQTISVRAVGRRGWERSVELLPGEKVLLGET